MTENPMTGSLDTTTTEAAAQQDWLAVLAARRAQAAQPHDAPTSVEAAATADPTSVTPAAPVDVEAIVDAPVAKALEQAAERFASSGGPETGATNNDPSEAVPSPPGAREGS